MIVKGKPKYDGVLNIPEGTSGAFAIVHKTVKAGTKFSTATMRTAFNAGHRARSVRYRKPTTWHYLTENGGVWMSDVPVEQWQHDQVLPHYRGRVLVGGLGLGYAVTALSAMPKVREIVVVEKSQDVVNLVYDHVKTPKTTCVCADLFDYLKDSPVTNQFDFAFYDIWQGDGEATFHDTVIPLRSLSAGKVRHVDCWNEDVMRGQLMMGMQSRLMWLMKLPNAPGIPTVDQLADPKEQSVWLQWSAPYWRWFRRTQPEYEIASGMAVQYCRWYGIDHVLLEAYMHEPVTSFVMKRPRRRREALSA